MSAEARDASREAWHLAVMWHGIGMLERLRALSPEERQMAMNEAGEHNLAQPLWLFAGERRFRVPSWSKQALSGGEVAALIVFGLWVQIGENEEMAPGLINDWPEIKIAVALEPYCR